MKGLPSNEGIAILVQARLGSRRLKGKSLRLARGRPLIVHLIDRLLLVKLPVILAVPTGEGERFHETLVEHFYDYYASCGKEIGQDILKRLSLFEGSEEDVLGRFMGAVEAAAGAVEAREPMEPMRKLHTVIRVTGDNPFISISSLCTLVARHLEKGCELSYCEGLPYGAGVEVISVPALKRAEREATRREEREHVTPYFYQHPEHFDIRSFKPPLEYCYPELRLTVDTEEDFNRLIERLAAYSPLKQPHSCTPPLRSVIPLRTIIKKESEREQ